MLKAGTHTEDRPANHQRELSTGDRGPEEVQRGDDPQCSNGGARHDQQDGKQGAKHLGGRACAEIRGTPSKRVGHPAQDDQSHRHDGEGHHHVKGLLHDWGAWRVEKGLGVGAEGQEAESGSGHQQDVPVGLGCPGGRREHVQGDAEHWEGQHVDSWVGEHPGELFPDGIFGAEPHGRAALEVDVGQHGVGGQHRQHAAPYRGADQGGPAGERQVAEARSG